MLIKPKSVKQLKQEALEKVIKPFQAAIESQQTQAKKAKEKRAKIEAEIREKQKAVFDESLKIKEADSEIEEAKGFITNAKDFFK
tara:strand:+ start:9634 stop:9888 length:255 start_codon:yes stop_codon:yes gene_type:complete